MLERQCSLTIDECILCVHTRCHIIVSVWASETPLGLTL